VQVGLAAEIPNAGPANDTSILTPSSVAITAADAHLEDVGRVELSMPSWWAVLLVEPHQFDNPGPIVVHNLLKILLVVQPVGLLGEISAIAATPDSLGDFHV